MEDSTLHRSKFTVNKVASCVMTVIYSYFADFVAVIYSYFADFMAVIYSYFSDSLPIL